MEKYGLLAYLSVEGAPQAAAKLGQVHAKTVGLHKSIGTMTRGLRDMGMGLRTAASGLMIPMAAMSVAMGLAVRELMRFDKAARMAGMIGGLPYYTKHIEGIRSMSKTIAMEMPFAAAEVAGALAGMAKSGIAFEEAGDIIAPALHIAKVEGMNTFDAMRLLTITMAKFGIEGKDAAKTADIMSRASDYSKTTIRLMGDSMKYAGSGARMLGIDVGQTSTLLAILANQGHLGSMAGTQLQRVFVSLADPKKREELRRYGIQVEDTRTGKFLPLRQMLVNLFEGFKGIRSQTERSALAFRMFGIRGIQGFTGLYNSGIFVYDLMERKIARGAITVKEKFDILAASWEEQWNQIKASLGVLGITILETFGRKGKKGIKSFIEFINDTTRALMILKGRDGIAGVGEGLDKLNPKAVVFAKGIVKGIQDVQDAFAKIEGYVSKITERLSDEKVQRFIEAAAALTLLAPAILAGTTLVSAAGGLTAGGLQVGLGAGRVGAGAFAGTALTRGAAARLPSIAGGLVRGAYTAGAPPIAGAAAGTVGAGAAAQLAARTPWGLLLTVGMIEAGTVYAKTLATGEDFWQALVEDIGDKFMGLGNYLSGPWQRAAVTWELERLGFPTTPGAIEAEEARLAPRRLGAEMAAARRESIQAFVAQAEREDLERSRQMTEAIGFLEDIDRTGRASKDKISFFSESNMLLIQTVAEMVSQLAKYQAEVAQSFWERFVSRLDFTVKMDTRTVGKALGKGSAENLVRHGTQLPPWQRRAIIEHGAAAKVGG